MSYTQQRNLALSLGWACFDPTSWQSCMVSNTWTMPVKALLPKHDPTCHSKKAQMNSRTLIPRAPHSLQRLAATVGSRWRFLSDYYRCGSHTQADKPEFALCLELAKDLIWKITRSHSQGTCSSYLATVFQNKNWLTFLRWPHALQSEFCPDEVLGGKIRRCFSALSSKSKFQYCDVFLAKSVILTSPWVARITSEYHKLLYLNQARPFSSEIYENFYFTLQYPALFLQHSKC